MSFSKRKFSFFTIIISLFIFCCFYFLVIADSPVVLNESPSNGVSNVELSPYLNVTVVDNDDDIMDVDFYMNRTYPDIPWDEYNSNPIDIDGQYIFSSYASCIFPAPNGSYLHYFGDNDGGGDRAIYRAWSNQLTPPDWHTSPSSPILTGDNVSHTFIAAANVWYEDGEYRMLVGGYSAGNCDVYYINSSDGINWVVQNSGNPILESSESWEQGRCEPWGLIKDDDTYRLFINNIDTTPGNTRYIGSATSTDLINWVKDENNPYILNGSFCPDIFKYEDNFYLLVVHYTSGSDYAEPDLYRCNDSTFYPERREYIGVAWETDDDWDWHDMDCINVIADNITKSSFTHSGGSFCAIYGGEDNSSHRRRGYVIEDNISKITRGDDSFHLVGNDTNVANNTVASFKYPYYLSDNYTYYWYVDVDDGTGSTQSSIYSFSTSDSTLEEISFQSINNQTNNSITQDSYRFFKWTKVDGVINYSISVGNSLTDNQVTDVFLQLDNITVSNGACTNTWLNVTAVATESPRAYNYWENTTHCIFYLPDCYNISGYGYDFYQVRAYYS